MSLLEDAKNLRDLALGNPVILRHFDARLKPVALAENRSTTSGFRVRLTGL
jgi:hypothetical protein